MSKKKQLKCPECKKITEVDAADKSPVIQCSHCKKANLINK